MHIYNMSVIYLQSIKRIHWKLKEELISQSMHCQYYGKHLAVKKIGKVKNAVNLSKIIFSALKFFMHIFDMSVTYLQSIKRIHWNWTKIG